jgi:soluble lytic murein transglycosylase-like protein
MKFASTSLLFLCSAYFAEFHVLLLPRIDCKPALKRLHPKPFVDTHALIHAAAKRHRVPEAFVTSIVAAESNFKPDAVSNKGAIGLMQLMPQTAQQFGADPKIPEENIDAGTRYLGWLMSRYGKYRNGMSRAIAAYNAGPGVVDHYRGVPPYRETRGYVARVLAFMKRYKKGERA